MIAEIRENDLQVQTFEQPDDGAQEKKRDQSFFDLYTNAMGVGNHEEDANVTGKQLVLSAC